MAEHNHSIVSCLVQLTALFRGGAFNTEMLGCVRFLINAVFDALQSKQRPFLMGASADQKNEANLATVELYKAVHGTNPPQTFGMMDEQSFGVIGDGAILAMLLPLLLKLFELWLSKQAKP